MIRRVLKKGTSFVDLVQDDVSLMMSHINSYVSFSLVFFGIVVYNYTVVHNHS